MKKTVITLSLILLIVFLMFGINIIYNEKQEESEKEGIILSESNEEAMPQIKDILIGDDYYIALCTDKTVWSWGGEW